MWVGGVNCSVGAGDLCCEFLGRVYEIKRREERADSFIYGLSAGPLTPLPERTLMDCADHQGYRKHTDGLLGVIIRAHSDVAQPALTHHTMDGSHLRYLDGQAKPNVEAEGFGKQ